MILSPAALKATSVFHYADFLAAQEAERQRRSKVIERARDLVRRKRCDIHIEFVREDQVYWIHGPLDDTEHDPIANQHLCQTGDEVLAQVQAYVAALFKE